MGINRCFLRVLAGAAAAACALSVQAQSASESNYQRVERTKILRVGVIAGAIPYFNKSLTTGKWDGFGPDFGESLAQSLGAKTEFVETTWGNAVLDLQSNKIDVMFGLAPSPARREAINFSDTLFENTYTVVCRKDYPQKTWAQFNSPDSTISLDVGSSHDQLATRILPKANILRLDNSGAATLALQSGRADCQMLVILLAQPLLVKRPDIGTVRIPTPVETAPVDIGLRKEPDPALLNAVNKWLAETRAKGDVKQVILNNMEKLAGVKPGDFPPEVKF